MGLDLVELVMQCEEVFGIEIPDNKAEKIHTVGDLYYTVLDELHIERPSVIPMDGEKNPKMLRQNPWTQANVWQTVHAVVVDQLQVKDEEVVPQASFQNDLGAD